jgi:hypothetical protein
VGTEIRALDGPVYHKASPLIDEEYQRLNPRQTTIKPPRDRTPVGASIYLGDEKRRIRSYPLLISTTPISNSAVHESIHFSSFPNLANLL